MDYRLVVQIIDTKNNMLTGSCKNGEEVMVEILEPWIHFVKYIEPMLEISIRTVDGVIDERGYIVLDPYFLISTTMVVEAMSCHRKIYVNFMGASDIPERRNLRRIMEGNALHDVFSLKLVNSELKHEELIDIVVNNSQTELITLNIDEDDIRDYLNKDARPFNRFAAIKGETELDCQNWRLGIHGKFDGLVKNNILELKSSKIPDAKPWEDHNSQINIYKEIMSDRGNFKGSVYYTRDQKMIPKLPYDIEQNTWIMARNWAYLILIGKYIPKILRGNAAKQCKYCFKKNGCHSLCAALNFQRDCSDCEHIILCDKKEWSTKIQENYIKLNLALSAEEHEEIKAQRMMAMVGTEDPNKELLISRGYALRSLKKNHSEFEKNGYFKHIYSHRTRMNRFRRGDRVQVFNDREFHNTTTIYHNAIIKNINASEITLLSNNILPKHIVVVSSSSSAGYRTGKRALFFASQSTRIIFNIINGLDTEFKDIQDKFQIKNTICKYNHDQLLAITKSLNTPDLFLIQGPAGTGKTSVIAEIVNQLFYKGKRILVSAFTNMAIDNVGWHLHEAGIPFIRLGNQHSIDPKISEYHISVMKQEYITAIEEDLPIVILSTTSTIARDQYNDLLLDYVLLDEAAQMTIPECLKALLRAEKAILVGDHNQLQPIIISNKAKSLNLHISLFEYLVHNTKNRHILLTNQYRMNDEILQFPNYKFYNDKLISATNTIANQSLSAFSSTYTDEKPYQVIAIFDKMINHGLQINGAEIIMTIELISELLRNNLELKKNEIGIITPFRAQVAEFRSFLPDFTIDTVDRYQGSEKEIILLSTITTADIPILMDPRRFNVALTRAKKKMIVLLSNPKIDGVSLVNQIYRDAYKRGLVTEINSSDINYLSNDVQLNRNLKSIDSEAETVTNYNPYLDVHFGKSSGIYYNTILLMKSKIETEEVCIICKQKIDFGVQCIGCAFWFHWDHLHKWVEKEENCPVCSHVLKIIF